MLAAVAVRAAGGEGVFPHEIRSAALRHDLRKTDPVAQAHRPKRRLDEAKPRAQTRFFARTAKRDKAYLLFARRISHAALKRHAHIAADERRTASRLGNASIGPRSSPQSQYPNAWPMSRITLSSGAVTFMLRSSFFLNSPLRHLRAVAQSQPFSFLAIFTSRNPAFSNAAFSAPPS